MNNIEFLCGSAHFIDTPLRPFADEVCDFLSDLSSTLLKSKNARLYPDLSAIAFWCRRSNIQNMKKSYDDIESRIGRGLCFHITPSNIPINFAFSYVFSLLAGNSNVVRLPSQSLPQVDVLCTHFKKILVNYPEIEKRTTFVKYPKNNNATHIFSEMADCRMIWGGNETIASVKKMNTKPKCLDLTFSDRYSLAIINAEMVLNASNDEIQTLSENFYNDTYLMDQNACSSPQVIGWIQDNQLGRKRFWDAIYKTATSRYELQDSVAVDKYTTLCTNAIHHNIVKTVLLRTNLLYRTEFSQLTSDIEHIRGVSGYFYEYSLDNYDPLLSIISDKYQTITYFGINPDVLKQEIINRNLKGVDRIVPVGKAMEIGINWDGYDLLRSLSRKIVMSKP